MATLIRRLPAAFMKDRRGNVAIMFGIALPVIAIGALMAVDYSRASNTKQTIQEALDAAALIAARSSATTSDAIDAVGDAAFKAQLPADLDASGFTPNGSGRLGGVTFTLTGTKVVASATGQVTPTVTGLFIDGPINVHANTEVVRSINKLEIAMVLDTTGSMSGTKLSNLKAAAKSFITTMESAAARSTDPNSVRIALVPFSTSVRVSSSMSMSSYNNSSHSMSGLPTWLDGRAQSMAWNKDLFKIANSSAPRIDRFTMLKNLGQPWGGCVEARAAPYDIRETAPDSSNVDTLFAPYFAPDEPDTSTAYDNSYLNDGSTGNWSQRQGNSAKYSTALSVSSSSVSNWSYGPNQNCNKVAIMRLTTSFSSLRTHIDTFTADGETNIPLGLMWGWHAVSPNAPLADGVAYGTPNTTKIIILMTDGDNTMSDPGSGNSDKSYYHGYGYVWQGKIQGLSGSSNASTRTTKMNNRMVSSSNQEDLCSNIRNRGILIYSVGVGVSSSSAQLLTDCAGTSDRYFSVDSSGSTLDDAFNAIAGSIQNLRISK